MQFNQCMFPLPEIRLFLACLIMSYTMHLEDERATSQGPGPCCDFLCLSPLFLFGQVANASHKSDLMLLQWAYFSSVAQFSCDIQEVDCQACKLTEKYTTLNHGGLIRYCSWANGFWSSFFHRDKLESITCCREEIQHFYWNATSVKALSEICSKSIVWLHFPIWRYKLLGIPLVMCIIDLDYYAWVQY